ncbi:aldehyde ferredoxin oxidoreductase family protein [Caloramator proteoclasticus]|uniref:Aldehyde:ferredoxin oxidoreductase n=1 Tax=Caloramator proteoclasticus DSM 10124 TaxID=1121262 RepID=A0A1M5A2K8_9CLOT|nr:aldehyde ferredoxin oxidoreductase family protein [Caloramator proteoclasticus]SHF24474.1 aldehyde:ferredoxin oxidoreductase [Caloramator proteoclasticus DSM 10124]
MFGYRGTILRVNLTTGEIKKEELDKNLAEKFIGGRGLATKLYYDEVGAKVDPFDEKNKIIIATGPLTGTIAPTGGRYMVVTKSPLTGTIACSNSGGFFGAELKNAGYDMIIIEGRAQTPVYLWIEDDVVEIRDASHLWGKVVSETTDELKKVSKEKARVLCIGPAGEKLSKIAAVINDYDRAAGRSGVGAVMGSKNLKAIVAKGTGKVELKSEDELKQTVQDCIKKLRDNGVTGQGLPTYGTAVLVNIINENGVFPTNNFKEAYFEKTDNISGETMTDKYLVRKNPCYRCPIACGRWVKIEALNMEAGGPEYETLWAFGADCGIDDIQAIFLANHLCNEYGLDTISTGATIAAAMELYEKGLIKDDEVEGTPLKFGNKDAIIEWTKKMGLRQGFGDKLAEGSYRLCEMYGVPELSMSVKKQELPAYDPRAIQGHGLEYATSNRGGCHVRGYMISPEILGLPEKLDRHSLQNKAEWVKVFQDLTAVIDSLGLCLFTSFALGAEDYAKLLDAACGFNYDKDSILEAGDRIYNLERMFNLDAGIDPSEDTLPKRLLTEPIPDGPSKGHVHRLQELLPKYYEVRGWDEKGIPTKEKLQKLGL